MADTLSRKTSYIALLLILLLATYLRFTELDKPGLWLDEVSYTIAAQRPILDQITNSTETLGGYLSVDPTLSAIPFSLFLKLGFSNFIARFPAALFGILGVALIYRLGQTLFDNRVGLVAALLLATSSFHILYSQEARSYAQFVFFSMASFLFIYQAFTTNKFTYWLLYTLCTWGGVSTNHLMIFVIGVQSLFLFLVCLQDINTQKNYRLNATRASLRIFGYFLLSLMVVFILRTPWLEDFTERQCAGCDIGAPSYSLDLVDSTIRSLETFASNPSLIAVVFVGLSLFGLMLVFLHYTSPRGIWLATWLLLSIPVTATGLWFISQFFHPRYTIWGLPAFLLAIACGLSGLSYLVQKMLPISKFGVSSETLGKWAGLVSISLLILPLLISNLWQTQHNTTMKQKWPLGQLQEATNLVASQANSQETVIVIGLPVKYLKFYMPENRQDLTLLDPSLFGKKEATVSLPTQLTGRWYVLHNSFKAPNIPKRWFNSVDYYQFHDFVVVHRPEPCTLEKCLNQTKNLLLEISQANPDSNLANNVKKMYGIQQ